MRHVRPMLVVLALAHIALLVGMIAANLTPLRPLLRNVLQGAVMGSQFCLLGIWAGVGRSRGVLRLLLVCLLAWPVGAIWVLGPTVRQLASQGFSVVSLRSVMAASLTGTMVFLVGAAMVALPLVWLRSRGRSLVDFGSQAPLPRGLAVQFSIHHVLVATVALALLLAAGQFVRSVGNVGEDGSVSFQASASGVAAGLLIVFLVASLVYMVGIPVTALWACLGRERAAPRLLLVLLLVLAAAACPLQVFGGIRHLEFALVMIVEFGILAASLLVFRRLGYRWITAEALWECSLPSADELRRPVAGPAASGVSPFRPPDSPGRQGP